jgi:single-strand DNA-binding protein
MYQQLILLGYLGSDPELREVSGGVPVANFRMAVNRRWTTAEGQVQEKTNWYQVTAWRRLAELAKQYLVKGSQVMVIGEVSSTRAYTDRDGNLRASIDVTANDIRFVDTRRPDHEASRMANDEQPEAAENRVPF